MSSRKSKSDNFFSNKVAVAFVALLILAALFAGSFFLTTFIVEKIQSDDEPVLPDITVEGNSVEYQINTLVNNIPEETTRQSETTTGKQETTAPVVDNETPGNVDYPLDDASWKLICLNRNRYVGSAVENQINLSYVAGSGELMDSRAARAYEAMYDAAAEDGIYLTPCSGYRSYSTQKRLYNEFFYEYIDQGYSESEAHDLTSKRRNPPGSSEHNIGICMDIICASSSANFQNTKAYAWLTENAHNYGFILRYPEDKVAITGVKFEPWHWRYVGVENAASIKNSGLCLEEYLGVG